MPAPDRATRLIAILWITLLAAADTRAQCEPGWIPGLPRPGADGSVYATLFSELGGQPALYVAGTFQRIGNTSAFNIARWDGRRWNPLGDGIAPGGYIRALAEHNGRIFAGGYLPDQIYQWDGQTWSLVGSGPGSGWIVALASYHGALYAVRSLGTVYSSVDRWDGQSWSSIASITGDGQCLAVYEDELCLGGAPLVNGVNVGHVARWDGTRWQQIGDGLAFDVCTLCGFGGELFAAGAMTGPQRPVARWSGSTWITAAAGLPEDISATALATSDGELFMGGTFGPFDDGRSANLVRWNGAQWEPAVRQSESSITSLCVFNHELFSSTDYGGFGVSRLVDDEWRPLQHGIDGPVRAIAQFAGETYIATKFSAPGTDDFDYIARGAASSWRTVGAGTNSDVTSLAVFESQLYAAGYFTRAGETAVHGLARWDGNSWSAFEPPIAPPTALLAVYRGALYAFSTGTGSFDWHDLTVSQWDGVAWRTVGTIGGNSRWIGVWSTADFQGELYVAGRFDLADGIAVDGLARWDGKRWDAVGVGGPVTPFALQVYRDELYANGYQPGPRAVLSRWDGLAWREIESSLDGYVYALEEHEDRLWVVGDFTVIGGLPTDGLATLDGEHWEAIPGRFDEPPMVVTSDDKHLYFGGEFQTLDDRLMPFLACRTLVLSIGGNIDRDGDVDLADLSILLSNFGAIGVDPTDGDTNGDGNVGIEDLATVLAQFGSECP